MKNSKLLRSPELLERRLALTVGFVTHDLAPPDPTAPNFVELFDVDGDGDDDLISNDATNSLVWFENTDGLGKFGDAQSLLGQRVNRLLLADIDGDGLTDIVYSSKPSWMKNLGNGNYDDPRPMDGGGHLVEHLLDVDGDGDIDIVSRRNSLTESFLYWHENVDGVGSFEVRESIQIGSPISSKTHVADINGDQRDDILLYNDEVKRVSWFEGAVDQGPFSIEHDIPAISGAVGYFASADWDGDQDVDLVLNISRSILWFENDGHSQFAQGVELLDLRSIHDLQLADLDGDEDLDIAVTEFLGGSGTRISWFENEAGSFDADSIKPFYEQTPEMHSGRFALADIDGDGDLDVFSSVQSSTPGSVWQENMDAGVFGPMQQISEVRPSIEADRVQLADVDGDGDQDMIWSSIYGSKEGVFQRESNGTFGEPQVRPLNDELPFAGDRGYSDLDGDGDLDVFDRTGGSQWFQLNADRYEAKSIAGSGDTTFYEFVDVDGDSDGDLVTYVDTEGGANLLWRENQDNSDEFGPVQILPGLIESNNPSVFPFDADQDGDFDIVIQPRFNVGEYLWFENSGDKTFSSLTSIDEEFGQIDELLHADSNGDGLADLVIAITGETQVWQRSLASPRPLAPCAADGRSRTCWMGADLDGDRDIDLIQLGRGYNLRWREQIEGVFSPSQDLINDIHLQEERSLVDVDGDGDLDVISAGRGRVAWYENRLLGDANDDGIVNFADFLVVSANFGAVDAAWEAGDFTGDGQVSFEDFLALSANFRQSRNARG